MKTNSDIESAKAAFTHWRENRSKRGRVPQELWEIARQLSLKIGTFRVSKELGVNYTGLKRYIEMNTPDSLPQQDKAVTFTELKNMNESYSQMEDVTLEVQIKDRSIKLTLGSIGEHSLQKMIHFLSKLS